MKHKSIEFVQLMSNAYTINSQAKLGGFYIQTAKIDKYRKYRA